MSQPDPNESILQRAGRLKRADRKRQQTLPPAVAQSEAELVFDPAFWRVTDRRELAWPGDLGDAAEDPDWLCDQ